jgi:hypothetical protein
VEISIDPLYDLHNYILSLSLSPSNYIPPLMLESTREISIINEQDMQSVSNQRRSIIFVFPEACCGGEKEK